MSNGQKTNEDSKPGKLERVALEQAAAILDRIETDPLKFIEKQLDVNITYEELRILMAIFDCPVDKVAVKILKHKRGHKQF